MAVPSRAAAVRALQAVGLNVSDAFLRDYGHPTSNVESVEAATSAPGTVLVETGRSNGATIFSPVPVQK